MPWPFMYTGHVCAIENRKQIVYFWRKIYTTGEKYNVWGGEMWPLFTDSSWIIHQQNIVSRAARRREWLMLLPHSEKDWVEQGLSVGSLHVPPASSHSPKTNKVRFISYSKMSVMWAWMSVYPCMSALWWSGNPTVAPVSAGIGSSPPVTTEEDQWFHRWMDIVNSRLSFPPLYYPSLFVSFYIMLNNITKLSETEIGISEYLLLYSFQKTPFSGREKAFVWRNV